MADPGAGIKKEQDEFGSSDCTRKSKNDGYMSKGHKSQTEGSAGQIWDDSNIKINNDST